MKSMIHRAAVLALFAFLGTGFSAGCQHELFSDADHSRESINDRYYDGDSAVQTTESRRKANAMGFGYPTGAAPQ